MDEGEEGQVDYPGDIGDGSLVGYGQVIWQVSYSLHGICDNLPGMSPTAGGQQSTDGNKTILLYINNGGMIKEAKHPTSLACTPCDLGEDSFRCLPLILAVAFPCLSAG